MALGVLAIACACLASCETPRRAAPGADGAQPGVGSGAGVRAARTEVESGRLSGTMSRAPGKDRRLVVFARPKNGAVAALADVPVIRRTSKGMQPEFLVVSVGQEVRFENADKLCHEYFATSRTNPFKTGLLRPTEHGLVRFERPGLVTTYCALHRDEHATILVVPSRHFAVVKADGSFEVAGLPPGSYELMVWTRKAGARLHTRLDLHSGERRFLRLDTDQAGAPSR